MQVQPSKIKPSIINSTIPIALRVDQYFAVGLLFLVIVYYGTFLGIFCAWFKKRPVINRSPKLVAVSAVANFVLTVSVLFQKCIILFIQNPGQYPLICSFQGGINIFNLPLLFAPYILRAYRLFVVFSVDSRKSQNSASNSSPSAKRTLIQYPANAFKKITQVNENNLIIVLLMLTLPFLCLFAIFIALKNTRTYFPYTQINNCFITYFTDPNLPMSGYGIISQYEPSINISIFFSLLIIFFELLSFAFCMYRLRFIRDEFSIMQELKFAYIAWGLCAFSSSLLICFGPGNLAMSWLLSPYFFVLRNIALFSISVVSPARKSFSRYQWTPHQSKYCASNFNIASQTELPSMFFNNYLNTYFNKTGSRMFQLFMQIRIFEAEYISYVDSDEIILNCNEVIKQNPNEHQLFQPRIGSNNYNLRTQSTFSAIQDAMNQKNQITQSVKEIYYTYLAINAPFRIRLPIQCIKSIQNCLFQGNKSMQTNSMDTITTVKKNRITNQIFNQLKSYITEQLQDYYNQFKRSCEYQDLLNELEKRQIQHCLLVKLQMTPIVN